MRERVTGPALGSALRIVHMPHDPIMVLGDGAFPAVDADGDALAGGEHEVVAVDALHESGVDQVAAVASQQRVADLAFKRRHGRVGRYGTSGKMDGDGVAFDLGVLDGLDRDPQRLVIGDDRNGSALFQTSSGQSFQTVEADIHLLRGGRLDQVVQRLHLIAEKCPLLHAGHEDDGEVGAPDSDLLGETDAVGLVLPCVDVHEQQIRLVALHGLKQIA